MVLLTREQIEERLAALHRASLELVSNLSLETLLERIVVLARSQVDAKYAALGVLDARGELTKFIPVGMSQEDELAQLPLDLERLGAGVVLVDLVYGGSETRLIGEARRRNAVAVDGLEVLVRQGAESLRIWTGTEPPLDVMREAARGG